MTHSPTNVPRGHAELDLRIASLVEKDFGDESYWEEILRICTGAMIESLDPNRALNVMINAIDQMSVPHHTQFPIQLYRDSESGLYRASFFAAEYPRYGRGENALILIRFEPSLDPSAGVNEFAVRVGALIADSIRTVDVPCRWSRDEFLVLLPRTSVDQAKIVARRIHQSHTVRDFPKGSISVAIAAAANSEPIQDVYGRASWSAYDAHVTGTEDISIA